jgi:2-C-methyl-D-erythritol 4-phosphate cytidylyltransferase/2-C-methyl-D-erythritol 2,4-cyclodiphosphate synthase
MPDSAPKTKIDAVRKHGGEPRLVPMPEVFQFLKEHLWEQEPFAFIHPWTNRNVMIGHGTIGLEIIADCPKVDSVFIPVGGGGLIGGVASALKALNPFVKVFAVQPVLNPDDTAVFNAAVHALRYEPPANGGATRQASVHAGLEALASQKPDVVLIHDAARPFVSAALISRAIEAASLTGAAIPAIQVTDTIKQVGETGNVEATPERARLRVAQTPQAFRFDVILDAHRRAARDGRSDFTDDAALAEWAGLTVATFEGDPANMKLTTPEDFIREEARLGAMLGDIRTGTGYDVHAFGDGDHLMLCGVRVPHTRGFLAHSDGDVGLHALVDAILGALADGDIGSHFPPSDPQWKGAASDRFLKYAVDRVTARGGRIANLEVTMICERPKIGPLRDTMRERIADITGLNVSRIAVKATTSERLGFTGREEGIAATASATIRLPWGDKGWSD